MGTIKRDYKIMPFKITKSNINNFKVMESRRQISEGHVRRIHGAILSGRNPIGVLIVNMRNKETRLIDGNHRLEAIKRFYSYKKSHREMAIECILKVYTDLNDVEEKEVYSDEAKRRNESYEDRLNMYKEGLVFWKLLQGEIGSYGRFPCKVSIYPQKNSLRFRIILNAFYTVKSESKLGYYPKYLRKDDLIPFAMDLLYDDYSLLREFVNFFQEVFGLVSGNNIYTKTHFFIPLFDIYVKNRGFRKENDKSFRERFARAIGRTDILNYMYTTGREAQIKIRDLMLNYMNFGVSKNNFI